MSQADHPYARDLAGSLAGRPPGELVEMLVEIRRAIRDREAAIERLTASFDMVSRKLLPLQAKGDYEERLVLVSSYYQPDACRREYERPALVRLHFYDNELVAFVSNLTTSEELTWPDPAVSEPSLPTPWPGAEIDPNEYPDATPDLSALTLREVEDAG